MSSIRPISEIVWIVRKDFNTYIIRYKDGSNNKSNRLPNNFDDDEYSTFIIDMDSAIFIKKKYIVMNTIIKTFAELSKDKNVKKGYSILEGLENKQIYAKFTINSDMSQKYVCLRY